MYLITESIATSSHPSGLERYDVEIQVAAQMTAFPCYRNPLCGLRNTFHLFPTPSCPIPPQVDT